MPVLQLRRPESPLVARPLDAPPKAAPFLKWVGGSALFFAVQPKRALLADGNAELVHCYQQVRDDVYGVLDALARHVYQRPHFEAVRALEPRRLSPAARAARLIYLNKTCFNGLWRVNRAGRFNVPFGRYKNPRFNDPSALISASHASYTADGFGWEDQKRLAYSCLLLNRRGVRFLLSNSATPRIRELYRGFEQRMVRAPRFINSKADGRGRVDELLVFNA